MGADVFSEFLIPLKFKLDDPSKKKFDAALAETEKRFKEIGTAAAAAAVALAFAVKEIAKNLSGLAYAAERVGASSEELKALGNAADRVGIGAEAAKSSLSSFFAFVNFEGGASAIKQWFNIDFDPSHPLKAMLDLAVKLADEYATGPGAKRQTAVREAERAGINQTLLTTPGAARRLREEMEKDEAFTGGKLNPIAEKAKRLNAEFEKVKQHLKTISELVSGSLMDAFSDLLKEADGWLKAHRDDIIWFSNQAAELAKNIGEVTKSEWRLLVRLEANTAELMRTQDIIKMIREGLKWLADGSIANKINAALEWAFQPFKWLWDKLQSLGLVGPGGTGGTEAGAGAGIGARFSPGEGTESGGHGTERRDKFGHGGSIGRSGAGGGGRGKMGYRGANKDMGAAPTSAEAKATEKESWNFWKTQGLSDAGAAAMVATEQGESNFNPRSFGDADTGGAHGSFQWHMDRVNKILAVTGIDVRTASHLDQLKAAKWEGEHGDTQARQAWQAVLHATSAAEATRAMTYLFERPRDKPGDTYTRQGYANRILREHGAGIAKPLANLHMPAADFHKALETIRAAKPLAPWQQSMNEHHDNRVVNSNIEVKVAGIYPIDKTARPLERTKNATLIRNTTATAS